MDMRAQVALRLTIASRQCSPLHSSVAELQQPSSSLQRSRVARMRSVAAVCLLALLGLACAKLGPTWKELDGYTFEQYKVDFSKGYASAEEEAVHREVFEGRLGQIMAHNQDTQHTWRMGVNHLTDRPDHMLRSSLGYHKQAGALRRATSNNGVKWQSRLGSAGSEIGRYTRLGMNHAARLPYEVDWRNSGVVSAVKNQGHCGSCWAFAAAQALESHLALATGELYVLSSQEFVSCVANEHNCGGTGGCAGSVPQLAFEYAQVNGLAEEWSYPYVSYYGKNVANCSNSKMNDAVRVGHVIGHYDLPTNSQDALMEAVALDGPVSISVDASAWHMYEEGVFDGCNQTTPDINHAVQLVGYGNDFKDGDYWLVRNSWSPIWGERGYIRLRRELTPEIQSSPRCGIDIHPEHGTGCDGGPKEVEVCGTCGILYDNTIPIIERKEKLSSNFVRSVV